MRDHILAINDIYSVISELRTPLLEVKLLHDLDRYQDASEVSQQALKLFDSFLYTQKLEQNLADLQSQSYSLSSLTESVLHQLTPLAKIYNVKFQFEPQPLKTSVSVAKPAFDHATHSLLHSLVTSLQNKPKVKSLTIKVSKSSTPHLSISSPSLDIMGDDWRRIGDQSFRFKASSYLSGIQSGLLIAKLIYNHIGSKIKLVHHNPGCSFGINFRPTFQTNLMEAGS